MEGQKGSLGPYFWSQELSLFFEIYTCSVMWAYKFSFLLKPDSLDSFIPFSGIGTYTWKPAVFLFSSLFRPFSLDTWRSQSQTWHEFKKSFSLALSWLLPYLFENLHLSHRLRGGLFRTGWDIIKLRHVMGWGPKVSLVWSNVSLNVLC